MLFRKTVFVLALAGAAIPAAFATSGNNNRVGGEQSFETHAMQSPKSRADVKKELDAFRKNPPSAESGTPVGADVGDHGYVAGQHTYWFQKDRQVRTDSTSPNTPMPSIATTNAKPRPLYEQYINY